MRLASSGSAGVDAMPIIEPDMADRKQKPLPDSTSDFFQKTQTLRATTSY
jgi:hypothetical protein